jgi:hypothetical protein
MSIVALGAGTSPGKHHLKAFESSFAFELRPIRILLADQPGRFTRREERVKLLHAIGVRHVDRREGHHIGGMQSVPHGIAKKALRQVVIRLKMHGGGAAPNWLDCLHGFCECRRKILSLRFWSAKREHRGAKRNEVKCSGWEL